MKILDKIIIRTPLFPYAFIESTDYLNSKEFLEALYLASPTLYAEVVKYRRGLMDEKKARVKIEKSIYKYITRASSRCTPFGLFAGLSIANWSTTNKITIHSDLQKSSDRKTRLDMDVLCKLAQDISKIEYVKPYLKFFPNSSIYKMGDFYRFVEYRNVASKRTHKLSTVDYSEYLQYVFEEAHHGKFLYELIEVLEKKGIDNEEAVYVVEELVSAQLLVSELEPTVTGGDFFESICLTLQAIDKDQVPELKHAIQALLEIKNSLSLLDANKNNEIENYERIYKKLKAILPDLNGTNLFQTDLFKRSENAEINADIQEQITSVIQFLNKITAGYKNQNLEGFKKRFQDRYEHAEIPLLVALDPETGLGYPNMDTNGINNLIDDITFYRGHASNDNSIRWDHLQTILFQILIKAIKDEAYSVELTDNDFKGVDFSNQNLPHSFSVMFKVINSESNKISIENIGGGASAVNLLGRFAYGNDVVLDTIKEITKHEEEQMPGKILAEIAHLPESRTGNILSRPIIRNYEIPYLAKSGTVKENQINVNDLFLSVKNNSLILRSKKLNKEIIPRLGNAHNFRFNSLPVYYFLCDLQNQYFEKLNLSFNWGSLSNQFVFLPRVEYKNTILSPAKWQLKKRDFEILFKKQTDEEIVKTFSVFKEKHKLPEVFILPEGDNELLIDTKHKISIHAFIHAIEKKQAIILEEFLFDLKKPLVKDTNGNSFTNECIAIVLNAKNKFPDTIASEVNITNKKQYYTFGSEWVYYKIYSGIKSADYILKEKIGPVVQILLKENIIDKWFFIRYSDAGAHLRIRLHVQDLSKYKKVLDEMRKALAELYEEGIIYKIQTDTYNPELERYGNEGIKLAENLFYFDSMSYIDSLELIQEMQDDNIRWQYAILATDHLLNDFGHNMNEKLTIVSSLSSNFFKEHGGKKQLKMQLDNKFRKLRNSVDNLLSEKENASGITYPFIQILNKRSELSRITIDTLLQADKKTLPDIKELIGSYLHMMHNRIFISKQRTNEFVIYDMLARHYKSSIAKSKKTKSTEFV